MNGQESLRFLPAKAGERITLEPDHIILNDWQGWAAAQALGDAPVACADRLWITLDHECPAGTAETAAQQKKLIDLAVRCGARLTQCGVGYTLLAESGLRPGQVVAALGRHVSILGAQGVLGLRVTQEEMLALLRGGALERTVPRTRRIHFANALPAGTDAKDVLLSLLAGGERAESEGTLLRFSGDTLTLPQKAELCALAEMLGAVSALWDEAALEVPDRTVDLSAMQPMAALPGGLDRIRPVAELAGTKLDAVFLGGCLHGGIEDLRAFAAALQGRRVAREVRVMVSPATPAVQLQAMEEGILTALLRAGVHMACPGCGACKATAFGYMERGETLLSAGAFNYPGCAGSAEAQVYLASAATAAASALTGVITLPDGKEEKSC